MGFQYKITLCCKKARMVSLLYYAVTVTAATICHGLAHSQFTISTHRCTTFTSTFSIKFCASDTQQYTTKNELTTVCIIFLQQQL